jgi:hypothetical protein
MLTWIFVLTPVWAFVGALLGVVVMNRWFS